MIDLRSFDGLGSFQNDWLSARYHFSFAGYHDPKRMGWGPLRVWNDDRVKAGAGFDMHGHRDMEIITYIRRGAITHQDHLGNRGRTEAGDVQVMSAGKGILHAEFNEEPEDTELFQIWIEPRGAGGPPYWETRAFPKADRGGRLVALASGQAGQDEALPIDQDATLYGAFLEPGQEVAHELAAGRRAYLVVARGTAEVNGTEVGMRWGAAIAEERRLSLLAGADGAEVLLVDLP